MHELLRHPRRPFVTQSNSIPPKSNIATFIAPTVPYKTSISDAPSASVCPPHSSNIGSSPIGLLIDSPVDDFTFNAFDSFIDPIVPDISLILLIQLMILLTCLLQPSLSLLCPYSCRYNFN